MDIKMLERPGNDVGANVGANSNAWKQGAAEDHNFPNGHTHSGTDADRS